MTVREEDRCTATYRLFTEDGVEWTYLRCVQDRRHIYAPIGWNEGPWGPAVYMLPEARPHRFQFDIESEPSA